MKVILLQDIPALGQKSEVKDVREGYARNFLFTRKLAIAASADRLMHLGQLRASESQRQSKEKEEYAALAEKLKTTELTFKMKMGEKGHAFGSVSEADIQKKLSEKKIRVEKGWIALEEHIKNMGKHEVPIKFPQGVIGSVAVVVEAEA